jgi:hypothetical protein
MTFIASISIPENTYMVSATKAEEKAIPMTALSQLTVALMRAITATIYLNEKKPILTFLRTLFII